MGNKSKSAPKTRSRVGQMAKTKSPTGSKSKVSLEEVNHTLQEVVNTQKKLLLSQEEVLEEQDSVIFTQDQLLSTHDEVTLDLKKKVDELLESNHNLRAKISKLEGSLQRANYRIQNIVDENLFLDIKLRKMKSSNQSYA